MTDPLLSEEVRRESEVRVAAGYTNDSLATALLRQAERIDHGQPHSKFELIAILREAAQRVGKND